MEAQQPQTAPLAPSQITPTGGDWPAIPPAPAPVKPEPSAVRPEPLLWPHPSPPDQPTAPTRTATAAVAVPMAAAAAPETGPGTGPTPPAGAQPSPPLSRRARRAARRAHAVLAPLPPEESPVLELRRSVRRQAAQAGDPHEDLVWQPRFAYTSALIILFALTLVSLPLWIVLYQITNAVSPDGSGPRVADLVALCMMLLGGFLTGAAAWVIIIEMRGRVKMVDTLARTSERELITPEVADSPLEQIGLSAPTGPGRPRAGSDPLPSLAARAEAQHAAAVAMLEASSKLLSSFGSVLRSFGQLPAQVAMLVVALALFVGATVLSLS